ncbi:MAG TPA: glycosyltransferase family 4 protein [Balneolales bacterium]|nr:glycosyltransferase family 4 protein [Balneolales bacterium]
MSKPRRVAFLHYHLRGGGVTRVIEHAVESLHNNKIQSAVVCGEKPSHTHLSHIIINEKLAYEKTISVTEIGQLFKEIEHSVSQELGGKPDLWHIHNHHLGKNQVLPLLVKYMAKQNIPLLLQLHDFPEDGRPQNYQYLLNAFKGPSMNIQNIGEILYPFGPHIFYGTLNRKDYRFLHQSGIPESHLRLIPNAVKLSIEKTRSNNKRALPEEDYKRLILYPTRAIRRKNIGEFLLHALLSQKGDRYAVTLSPKNPRNKPRYDRWVAFSETLSLPVSFEAGKKSPLSFPQLLSAADLIMTTSIAEGFGLAFLEPWLAETPLYGRNLPDITDDFTNDDIQLNTLYNRFNIPLKWIDQDVLENKIRNSLRKVYQNYDKELTDEQIESAFISFVDENKEVDFGRLDEPLQEQIILKLFKNPDLKEELRSFSDCSGVFDRDLLTHNKQIIEEKYNLHQYGERLITIYDSLLEQKAGKLEYIDAGILLDQFLDPARFNLLRT